MQYMTYTHSGCFHTKSHQLPFNFSWNLYVLHNLPLNTDDTTLHHLKLAYEFVPFSKHSPGINLRWFSFNFLSIPSTPSLSCLTPHLVALLQNSHIVLSLPCLIEKDICDCQNISMKLPCVCVCLLSGNLFIFSIKGKPGKVKC